MNRTPLLWVVVLFFGTWLLFEGVHRLTDGQPRGVAIGAQFAALALVVAALVVYVRRRQR